MKKLLSLCMAVVMLLGFSIPALASVEATADLITDGGDNPTDVGDLVVNFDSASGNITVDFTSIVAPWELVETHVYISTVEAPQKHTPGKFPYIGGQSVNVGSGQLVYIAAHGEIRQWIPPEGEIPGYYIYETVWAQETEDGVIDNTLIRGNGRKGNAWATFFTITTPAAEP